MTRYWVSWVEKCDPKYGFDSRPAYTSETEKDVPEYWVSGQTGEGEAVLCAVVDCEGDPETVIERFWTPREYRFSEKMPSEWLPPSDRFPPTKRRRT